MSKRLKMQSKRRLGVSEPDVSATKDDTRIKIVHARDEYDLPLKDGFSTVAPDAHGKNSKDVKSTESEERVTNSESKDKDIKKGTFNLDNTRTGKRKDRFENSKRDADNSEQRTDDGRPMKLREERERGTINLLHCLMGLVLILILDKSKSARIASPPVSGNEDIDDLAVLVEEQEEVIRGGSW
ncbi:hypothetical protein ACFX10_019555 [Malus domestica]